MAENKRQQTDDNIMNEEIEKLLKEMPDVLQKLEKEKFGDKKILVVDDSNFARGIVVKELKEIGIEDRQIQEADDGQDALQKINTQQFDLFVLDIVMPGIDGIAVLKEIKKVQPSAKVIMCSSHSSNETIEELIGIGINDFVIKPFSLERFRDVVFKNLIESSGEK